MDNVYIMEQGMLEQMRRQSAVQVLSAKPIHTGAQRPSRLNWMRSLNLRPSSR